MEHKKHLDPPRKYSNGSSSPLKHSYHQQVLSSFLTTIPNNKGWWYRLPETLSEGNEKTFLGTDMYLPHMGAIFGLTEEATVIILAEMGLIKHDAKGSKIDRQGWDNLKALFGVHQELEVERSALQMTDGKKMSKWFVKVGSCLYSPIKIWRQRMTPPCKLVTRETSQFVCTQLVEILRSSNKFSSLLETSFYSIGLGRKLNKALPKTHVEENKCATLSRDNTKYDANSGNIVDAEQYPTLAKFKIPNNEQTTNMLLIELIRMKCTNVDEKSKSRKLIVNNPLNPSQQNLYMMVPSGRSETSHRLFGKSLSEMVSWRTVSQPLQYQEMVQKQSVAHGIKSLGRIDPPTFEEVAADHGHAAPPKMTANFWVAMSSAAGLRVGQQRIVNKFLSYHFGHRVCVSEKLIAAVGSDFVHFKSESIPVDVREYGVKKILFSWRDLDELIHKYSSELFENLSSIDRLEILLGGDHGKGAMNFIAVIIVRYKATKEQAQEGEPKILELQIGQVDHTKDNMFLLRHIVQKITPGITSLNPKEGQSVIYVEYLKEKEYKILQEENKRTVKVNIHFFLIGDLKFLFMMLGREGYAGTQCLYCTLLAKEWKEKHGEGLIECGGNKWTIKKLLEPFLNAQIDRQSSSQEQSSSASTNSRWQKEPPLWTFIPIENVIVPMLHILLGLGNDVIDNFWSEWFDERVEQLTQEEIESRQMVLLAEISVEESEAKFKRHDDEKKI